ncbi:MAG: DUF3450 domain-containing protein [Candidatus Pelagadaptatus aseana]|uniref:DUF3450 domain-containing protein n=1 Tax=Candidatus Pelagadaptatus aseana TaxID=3120508 RepID=UPI0039B19651
MRTLKHLWCAATLLLTCNQVGAATVNDSLKVVETTNRSAIASQKKVDKLALETQRMLEEYQRILRNTEYQDAYNAQLQQLKQNQAMEIDALKQQLNDINVTQMRIVPLMFSMVDALEKFVVLDLPFQQADRISAVVQLKQQLRNPSLSVPNKYRMLLEAFQVESDYGRTLDAYQGRLSEGEVERSVNFLRVGRIALYYQTLDGQESGLWHVENDQWQVLPETMNHAIKQAMRVARNQLSPQLMNLPVIKQQEGES